MHFAFDPANKNVAIDPHDLLLHAVAPRPIAFVSTQSPGGETNLAPFSFFMAGGSNPPSICFSPCTKEDGSPKDTLRNIIATREYVVHIVTQAMAKGMVSCSRPLPCGQSEWPESGFTQVPSLKVKPSRVAEAPFAMECRLHQIVNHGHGPDAANYVIGEVVMFHVASELIEDGNILTERVEYIARLGGPWYVRATPDALFKIARAEQ